MQFVAPDLLADACGLSVPLIVTGMVAGAVLWLFGWWTHRFWVVLITTVLAGLYGLYEAPAFRTQPLLAGLLLAIAAGLLALALVRLLAFLAGGMTGLLAIQSVAPNWDQPLLCFLGCGLASMFLFRVWMMGLTSFSGTLLLCHTGLLLGDHYGRLSAVAVSEERRVLLNWVCGGVAAVGLGLQYFFDYRRRRRQEDKDDKKERSLGYWLRPPGWGTYKKAG
jgi:hypothetical protein